MIHEINLVYILSSIFFLFFLIREFVSYKRYLPLKYFFTPSLTLILVIMMILSISAYGTDKYRLMIILSLLMALVADTQLMIEEISLMKNGAVFFIIGHIFYIAAFADNVAFNSWNIAVIVILAAVNLVFFRILIKSAGKKSVQAILYILILDLVVYFAIARLNNSLSLSGILAASGAILFMISDFILITNAFIKAIPHSTVFTWLFYGPAQYLIVLSTFVFVK
ncbi:MAG: lysoplasmalogenase [Spirochaetes bacterium]|nr:lysoplasmalogenase [Spirochaetota bacterium]